ncbi:DoxX family protein [Flammeovirga kamogawensis]|uniref:DoxX family membrane protein n=1 Tax=Flammeovirga kamogawensis TaxID=373891 RepID=A0ABX8H1J2_9BACT|nr:hypothetical protein [Flammeovirga kamogawensis]MBB6463791.1 putative membrane protein [Flammeovirga kamogawensis]QWG09701.1 hypothetical protein KM029_24180 [Flammeovirga kamogawensis]TRX65212.1 hypothetical protein EO216_22070 [Flammeovirga kamogawensis]
MSNQKIPPSINKTVRYGLGVLLFMGGVNHYLHPEFYNPWIFDFLPKYWINILIGCVEVIIALLLFSSSYYKIGGLSFCILMILFLPIHFLDLFKDPPYIGVMPIAIGRFLFQFVLIALGYFIGKDKLPMSYK